jgi:hypothetical protein
VSSLLFVLFSSFLLENDDLFVLEILYNFRFDQSILDMRRSDQRLPFLIYEENLVKSDFLAFFLVEFFTSTIMSNVKMRESNFNI